MILKEKTTFLVTQLGLDPGLPIVSQVAQARVQLGLAPKVGTSLVEQVDECLAILGRSAPQEITPMVVQGTVVRGTPACQPAGQPMPPAVSTQSITPVVAVQAVMAQPMATVQPDRLKLVLQDGRGIALESRTVDATHGRRAHFMRMTSAAEAIEVEFDSRGCVKVAAGHHVVGQHCLDNWHGRAAAGNRQHFSTWAQTHATHPSQQWTLNMADGTISPKNAPQLCLGWRNHSQLVTRSDPNALRFQLPAGSQISNSNNHPPARAEAYSNFAGRTSTEVLNGCWVASILPVPLIFAIYHNQSVGPDQVKACGIAFCFGLPCPFEEFRDRRAGTNKFVHLEDPNNVLTYDNPCFNLGCTEKRDCGLVTVRLCCHP